VLAARAAHAGKVLVHPQQRGCNDLEHLAVDRSLACRIDPLELFEHDHARALVAEQPECRARLLERCGQFTECGVRAVYEDLF
jgi:hypothetical protein